MAVEGFESPALARLAEEMTAAAWELALEVVDEGLRDDQIPSLERLGREGQLGDIPTFIGELAGELREPQPGRVRRGSQLAALVRDHARERQLVQIVPLPMSSRGRST